MSILDQFPRRFSRPAPAAAVPPGNTAEAGPQDLPPAAPGSWPWRRAALLASIAAQLITIAALESADPVPASWPALLLAVAPAPLALAAAFAPSPAARMAAPLAAIVLVTGMIGQATQTGLFYIFFLPALVAMIVAAVRLCREGA
jgi:hypothetical protein